MSCYTAWKVSADDYYYIHETGSVKLFYCGFYSIFPLYKHLLDSHTTHCGSKLRFTNRKNNCTSSKQFNTAYTNNNRNNRKII